MKVEKERHSIIGSLKIEIVLFLIVSIYFYQRLGTASKFVEMLRVGFKCLIIDSTLL